jgi:hypothetical protein
MNWQNRQMQRALLPLVLGGCLTMVELGLTPVASSRPLGKPRGVSMTGGVRGGCLADNAPSPHNQLIALVDQQSDSTLTIAQHPTFWFYLPFGQTKEITTAEFELLDENHKSVLQDRKLVIDLPAQAGLASFSLPTTEPALEPDKEYHWVFRVICDRQDSSANPKVSGWIKRVEPTTNLNKRLQITPATHQHKIYASDQIWHEHITQLAKHRTADVADWHKLLDTFGLREIKQGTLIQLKARDPIPETPVDESETGTR